MKQKKADLCRFKTSSHHTKLEYCRINYRLERATVYLNPVITSKTTTINSHRQEGWERVVEYSTDLAQTNVVAILDDEEKDDDDEDDIELAEGAEESKYLMDEVLVR